MIKAILFDVDGVVFKPRDKFFSQRLREQGSDISEDKVLPFFKNEYKLVALGKADLKTEVAKYLDGWKWQGTVEELLDFWFSYENKIDEQILQLVQELRQKGFKCYLASDHSRYRVDNFWNEVGLKNHFDGSYCSGYIGYTKEQPEFFQHVIKKINLHPEEILFIDDDPENVEIAKKEKLHAYHYKSFEELEKLAIFTLQRPNYE